jgi:tetratricopeptide (TPR) repeat protein
LEGFFMHRFAALALASFLAFPASPAAANDIAICENVEIAPAAGIAACSRLIARKKVRPQQLPLVYAYRALHYSRTGDLDRAIGDADARLRLAPTDAKAFRQRASLWLMKRDYVRAIRDAEDAVRLGPKIEDHWNVLGFSKLQSGDYDGATAAFDRAIKIDPKVAVVYTNRGNAWALKGDLVRALADHSRAVQLDPKDAPNWLNRANTYREMGELDKALADLKKAIAIAPRLGMTHAELGLIFRLKNDLPNAKAAYSRALELDPKSIGGYAGRGLLLESTGDIDGAKRDFQTALGISTGARMNESSIPGDRVFFDTGSHRYHEIARARLAVLAATEGTTTRAETADAGRRVALVIGNGAYKAAGALENPAKDAGAIAKSLKTMGYEVSEGIDLNRADMTKLIGTFLRNATNAKIAVLFYAGHGIQIDGKNYLLPVDARIANGAELTADMTDLDTILAGLDDQIRTNIVILDACRDNPTAESVTKVAGVSRSVAVRSGLAAPAGLGKGATLGAGTLLAFATAPGQVALDGDGDNSPFSAALSRHISTPGLEIQQVLTRVRAEVVAATKSKQVPWSNSSLLGEVFLVGGKP